MGAYEDELLKHVLEQSANEFGDPIRDSQLYKELVADGYDAEMVYLGISQFGMDKEWVLSYLFS